MKLHPNVKDATGKTFGRLTVTAYAGGSRWTCRCMCGKEKTVRSGKLWSGETRSCGCLLSDILRKRNATHGEPRDKTYHAWAHMIQRCTNVNDMSYKDYGARGIRVCKRWLRYERFLEDIGRPSAPDMMLDRINNNGNYEPGNCRWSTRIQQNRNKRSNLRYTFQGKTLMLAEWSEIVGVETETLRARLVAGWTVERTLTEPCWR